MVIAAVLVIAFVAVEVTRKKCHKHKVKKAARLRAEQKTQILYMGEEQDLSGAPPKRRLRFGGRKSGVPKFNTESERQTICAN